MEGSGMSQAIAKDFLLRIASWFPPNWKRDWPLPKQIRLKALNDAPLPEPGYFLRNGFAGSGERSCGLTTF